MPAADASPTDPARPVTRLGPEPPVRVEHPAQHHRWRRLTFLHWPVCAAAIAPTLPPGLTVDTFDDTAWIGLVLFHLDIRVPGIPYLPWAGRFVETNVRTYVRGPDGTPGIWFLSLDAARLGAVVTARATWSLPYQWSRMRLTTSGTTTTYECTRRWPRDARRAAPPRSRVVVDVGDAYAPAELTDLDHFLTARWTLFSGGRRLFATQADHPAWPLRHAEVVELDDGLVAAGGVTVPDTPPRARYSDGVAVRLGHRVPVPVPAAG
jgi:uncharacterized protein YqjF (DUF2071 family)